jgi:toxin ParE1/3/4
LKPATLRPQAKRDRQDEVRYYRAKASPNIAKALVDASRVALEQLQQTPGMGSPRIGEMLDVPGLRSWRVSGFPLIWFYFEREDCLDVVRLLGERQDILSILNVPNAETRAALAEADEIIAARRDRLRKT